MIRANCTVAASSEKHFSIDVFSEEKWLNIAEMLID